MNIKYRQLKAFALAGQLGSFAQAARVLSVTQPSFSVLIRELEHDLGMRLFERTTRSCRLTSAGASLHEEIHRVLHDLEDVYLHAKEISAGRRGRLSVAAVPSLAFGIMTKALGDYHRLYPDVRILLREEANESVVAAVRQDAVELGVACLLAPDAELSFLPLFSDRLVVIAPHGHPAVQGPVTWRTLSRHPMIMIGAGLTERAIRNSNLKVTPAFEVAHMATAMAMVRHGMGITLIPTSALDGLNTTGLQCVPMAGDMARRDLGILCRRRKPLSAAANAFIEVLRTVVPADGEVLRVERGDKVGAR
jgi:LysR family carnitine catabolism transcriptional activator